MPLLSKKSLRILRNALLTVVVLFCIVFGGGRLAAGYLMARLALTTGPNGPQTPAMLGVPFARVEIPSGPRRLDSYIVTAASSCTNPPVLLIYHGVQETISEWVKAQKFLYDHCVSSVIFDPTGSGNSSRPAAFEAIGEDSIAAYEFTVQRFPGSRIYVLGHSLGNAPMLAAEPHFPSPPAGMIVASAFASLRSQKSIQEHLLYRLLAYTIPDWWNNGKAVEQVHVPLLVIHSDTDEVNPVEGGRAIYAAAPQPKTLVILHGYTHNTLYQNPSEQWWGPVLVFVKAASESHPELPGPR